MGKRKQDRPKLTVSEQLSADVAAFVMANGAKEESNPDYDLIGEVAKKVIEPVLKAAHRRGWQDAVKAAGEYVTRHKGHYWYDGPVEIVSVAGSNIEIAEFKALGTAVAALPYQPESEGEAALAAVRKE